MELIVNGEACTMEGCPTVADVIAHVGAKSERVAVMVGQRVVPRDAFVSTRVNDGDCVEVLVFAGGG